MPECACLTLLRRTFSYPSNELVMLCYWYFSGRHLMGLEILISNVTAGQLEMIFLSFAYKSQKKYKLGSDC